MKRSEMVREIEDALTLSLDLVNPENINKTDSAEYILKWIEEAGMLPPEKKATPEDFVNIGFDQDFLDAHDFTVNKWEPEDD